LPLSQNYPKLPGILHLLPLYVLEGFFDGLREGGKGGECGERFKGGIRDAEIERERVCREEG